MTLLYGGHYGGKIICHIRKYFADRHGGIF